MTLAQPTELLPILPVRRWNKIVGTIFFFVGMAFTCVWTVVLAICVFICWPFSPTGEILWQIAQLWARGVIAFTGVVIERHEEAPLPSGPVIFVCNHQGNFDIIATLLGMGRRFAFIAKRSVFNYPFFGWGIRAMRFIPIDRSNREASIRTLDAAAERIKGGLTVVLFPEGTRSADGSILPFKKGPFMLALKAQVPIVPVAIEGSLNVNPKRRWYLCPNTVRVLIGPPIPTANLSVEERDALIGVVRGHVIRMDRRLGGLGGDEQTNIAAAGIEGIGRGVVD